ncbi:MAG: class I SAM-dependent methyltransferase [Casimicrobiaceae bacterium]
MPATGVDVIRDETYRRKLAWRGRGTTDLDRHVGGLDAEIESRLAHRETVRILELGCGYGAALADLRARYGPRVELHGLNRVRHDGDAEVMVRNARERGLLPVDGRPPADWLPTLHYGDVAQGLTFADRSFDLVFSQVAWLYFGDKVNVLRHVMRVLDDGGVAKIDADELRPGLPAEYARLVEIWDGAELRALGDYAGDFGVAFMPAPEGEYLRFGKAPGFGADLDLALQIDLAQLNDQWDGIKCIYRLRPDRVAP